MLTDITYFLVESAVDKPGEDIHSETGRSGRETAEEEDEKLPEFEASQKEASDSENDGKYLNVRSCVGSCLIGRTRRKLPTKIAGQAGVVFESKISRCYLILYTFRAD